MALELIARQYVFERVSFRTSFKSASVNLPTNCMFVVILIEGLRPGSYAKGFYILGEQSSSVEPLCLVDAVTGEVPLHSTSANQIGQHSHQGEVRRSAEDGLIFMFSAGKTLFRP
jgi:hypothetical protein